MSSFPLRLKELRVGKGLNQSDLAAAINASPSLINLMESAKRKPSMDTLIQLADTLGTSIDYLLGRTAAPIAEVVQCGNGPLASAYRRLTRLSPDSLALADSLLKAMLDQHLAHNYPWILH